MPSFDLVQWVGLTGLSVTASVGAAWAFIQFFGGKLIGHQLDRQLEAFKSEQLAKIEAVRASQAQTLERLRFDISASLDRTAKLHQFEFDVLPSAWRLLQTAVDATIQVIARARLITDIHRMDARARAELYARKKFSPYERERIETEMAGGPATAQKAFTEVEDVHRRRKAVEAYNELNACILEQGIFIQADLRKRLREVADLIREALYEDEDEREGLLTGKSAERREKRNRLSFEWDKLREEIEVLVQGRLWNARLPAIDQKTD